MTDVEETRPGVSEGAPARDADEGPVLSNICGAVHPLAGPTDRCFRMPHHLAPTHRLPDGREWARDPSETRTVESGPVIGQQEDGETVAADSPAVRPFELAAEVDPRDQDTRRPAPEAPEDPDEALYRQFDYLGGIPPGQRRAAFEMLSLKTVRRYALLACAARQEIQAELAEAHAQIEDLEGRSSPPGRTAALVEERDAARAEAAGAERERRMAREAANEYYTLAEEAYRARHEAEQKLAQLQASHAQLQASHAQLDALHAHRVTDLTRLLCPQHVARHTATVGSYNCLICALMTRDAADHSLCADPTELDALRQQLADFRAALAPTPGTPCLGPEDT